MKKIYFLFVALLLAVSASAQTFKNWVSTNTGKDSSMSENSYVIGVVDGCSITFDWEVSSESGYDWFVITLDGSEILKKSGDEKGSYTHQFSNSGIYSIVARYTKDSSNSSGKDYCSVSNFTIVVPEVPETPLVVEGDVNNDGLVNVGDVTSLVDIILYGDEDEEPKDPVVPDEPEEGGSASGGDDEDDNKNDDVAYDVMFSDTLYQLPVQNNDDYFSLPVVASQVCDYDRVFAVEVVDSISNAIEGRHYSLESNTVTIPAGQLVGNVKVRGFYDNMEGVVTCGFSLRLIATNGQSCAETDVVLKKICAFDINAFTGYCYIVSTFLQNYATVEGRIAYSVVDPEEENTIIIKDYFYDGYDIKVKFTTNDILNPLIKFSEQKLGPTTEAFGTKYGEDGIINVYQPTMYVSYYSSCEHFIWQYMSLYIPCMSGYNTVGTFVNAVEWISKDEAKKRRDEGYPGYKEEY